MLEGAVGKLGLKPEDGMDVVCTGRLTTYPARSNYQLVVEGMALAGMGALLKMLEERKKKLAAEGLFDEARKQRLAVFAGGDRRRHLADGRRDPRYPASPR